MPWFGWIGRRLGGRTTTEEIQELLNLDEDSNISDILDNERLLLQFIMRRWISEMDQQNRNTNDEPLNDDERNDNINNEITNNDSIQMPVLNMEDVDLALRDHTIQDATNQRGTFWIKFIDILGVTLFPMLFLRILKNVFSFISFSDDILEDTDNFLSYIQTNSFESLTNDNENKLSKSLISKFGKIVYEEMLYYYSPNNPNPLLARYLTLMCFYIYTSLTSLFMMISFVFLLLCLTYTIGKRWSYIDKFLVDVSRNSNGVF